MHRAELEDAKFKADKQNTILIYKDAFNQTATVRLCTFLFVLCGTENSQEGAVNPELQNIRIRLPRRYISHSLTH